MPKHLLPQTAGSLKVELQQLFDSGAAAAPGRESLFGGQSVLTQGASEAQKELALEMRLSKQQLGFHVLSLL